MGKNDHCQGGRAAGPEYQFLQQTCPLTAVLKADDPDAGPEPALNAQVALPEDGSVVRREAAGQLAGILGPEAAWYRRVRAMALVVRTRGIGARSELRSTGGCVSIEKDRVRARGLVWGRGLARKAASAPFFCRRAIPSVLHPKLSVHKKPPNQK